MRVLSSADAAARILLRHGYDLKRVDEDGRLREADVADLPNVRPLRIGWRSAREYFSLRTFAQHLALDRRGSFHPVYGREARRGGARQNCRARGPKDHREIVPQVGKPWSGYDYRFLKRGTSHQQALWSLFDRPNGESFWPEADIVYCPAESYVPVRRARLAVTIHDAAFFEVVAHRRNIRTTKQRLKWKFLFHKLSKHADRVFTVSQFSAERIAHVLGSRS